MMEVGIRKYPIPNTQYLNTQRQMLNAQRPNFPIKSIVNSCYNEDSLSEPTAGSRRTGDTAEMCRGKRRFDRSGSANSDTTTDPGRYVLFAVGFGELCGTFS